ncbi:MAG: UDP-N-acetylglucosamine 2-epimerase [Gemmatimonadetes bacterium]|nr:UDP-N-acetylglucosamine 2-epimerase [Gemmatimonadota bacterium]
MLSTLHRAELTDAPERLQEVITALGQLALPVLLPLHPRTRAAIDTPAGPFPPGRRMTVTPPLDYTRMLSAIRDASVVVTDSGAFSAKRTGSGRRA